MIPSTAPYETAGSPKSLTPLSPKCPPAPKILFFPRSLQILDVAPLDGSWYPKT